VDINNAAFDLLYQEILEQSACVFKKAFLKRSPLIQVDHDEPWPHFTN
jgi:hypothetical protein